jgi:hypothetical protein
MQTIPCQIQDSSAFSGHVSCLTILAHRTLWLFREKGMLATSRKISGFLMGRILALLRVAPKPVTRPVTRVPDVVLDLRPGEWVEVKTEMEILKLVDSDWRTRGLQFVPEMRDYFGRRLRVMKQVLRICIENAEGDIGEVRSLKNTVLLEEAMCKGAGVGCDRSCYYFWREAWLKRVDSNPP